MKLLAALAAAVHAGCPPQRSTGIDVNGDPDASNTSTCYPLKDAAVVSSCNDADGLIEMTIQVKQDLVTAAPSADFVKNDVDNTWDATFTRSEMTQGGTLEYLKYSKSFFLEGASANVDGIDLATTVGTTTEFSCKYYLGIQTVQAAQFTVSGSDFVEHRAATGNLCYTLDVTNTDQTTLIGQDVTYEIRPCNDNMVYARAVSCGVSNPEAGNTDFVHLINNPISFFDTCKQDMLDFTVVSGWGSKSVQSFKFTSFKWSTSRATTDKENQSLSCTIELTRAGWDSEANVGEQMAFNEWCNYHTCDDEDASNMGVIKQWTAAHKIKPAAGDWPSLNEDNPRHWPIRIPFGILTCAVHNDFSASQGMSQDDMVELNHECIVDTCRQKCWYRQQRWEKLRDGVAQMKSMVYYLGLDDSANECLNHNNCAHCETDADCNPAFLPADEHDNLCVPGAQGGPWEGTKVCQVGDYWIRQNPVSLADVIDNHRPGDFGYQLDHGCGHFSVELLEDPVSFNFVKHTGTRAYCKMWPDVPVTYEEDAGEPVVTYYEYKSRCLPKEDIELEMTTQTSTMMTQTTFPYPLEELPL